MNKDAAAYDAAIEELLDERKSWKQIIDSIKDQLLPDKNNWFAFFLSAISGGALALYIGTSENTVVLSRQICEMILDVEIAIFGCIFAVYSILLAFLSDSYVKKLIKINYGERSSYLKESLKYYEDVLLIYFMALLLSFLTKLVLICVPDDFLLTGHLVVDEIVACILLCCYLIFSIRVVYELKSIIRNTLLLFRSSIIWKIQNYKDEE